MLIRTRSEVVERVYQLFLERFPKPEDLCRSDLEEVKAFFKNLGLIQRARKLKEVVCLILEKYGGVLPCSYIDLETLPGIGRYIAGVLLTRVCKIPTPFVDANIIRFAKRFLGVQDIDVENIETWFRESISKELLEEVNIALLDFSAIICTPRNPKCGICPLRTFCKSNKLQVLFTN